MIYKSTSSRKFISSSVAGRVSSKATTYSKRSSRSVVYPFLASLLATRGKELRAILQRGFGDESGSLDGAGSAVVHPASAHQRGVCPEDSVSESAAGDGAVFTAEWRDGSDAADDEAGGLRGVGKKGDENEGTGNAKRCIGSSRTGSSSAGPRPAPAFAQSAWKNCATFTWFAPPMNPLIRAHLLCTWFNPEFQRRHLEKFGRPLAPNPQPDRRRRRRRPPTSSSGHGTLQDSNRFG